MTRSRSAGRSLGSTRRTRSGVSRAGAAPRRFKFSERPSSAGAPAVKNRSGGWANELIVRTAFRPNFVGSDPAVRRVYVDLLDGAGKNLNIKCRDLVLRHSPCAGGPFYVLQKFPRLNLVIRAGFQTKFLFQSQIFSALAEKLSWRGPPILEIRDAMSLI